MRNSNYTVHHRERDEDDDERDRDDARFDLLLELPLLLLLLRLDERPRLGPRDGDSDDLLPRPSWWS